jgi:hypothetical protein
VKDYLTYTTKLKPEMAQQVSKRLNKLKQDSYQGYLALFSCFPMLLEIMG